MKTSEMIVTYFQLNEQEKLKKLSDPSAEQLLQTGRFAPGYAHIVILQEDGTVTASGSNEYGQCNVSDWSGVIKVAAGDYYSVALKGDGTVLAAGDNRYGQCNVSKWSNIINIFADKGLTVGVKADGSVLFTSPDPVSAETGSTPKKNKPSAPKAKSDTQDQPPQTDDVEPTPIKEFDFKIIYNRLHITGYRGYRAEIKVPSRIQGYPVIGIASNVFSGSAILSKIILPESLEVINSAAFRHCAALKMIRIPNSVSDIGPMAFYGCKALREVTLPANLKTLGSMAFGSCPNLKRVKIPMAIKARIDSNKLAEAFDDLWEINPTYI